MVEGAAPLVDASPADSVAPDGSPQASRYRDAVLADAPVVYLRLGELSGTVAKAAAGPDGVYSVSGIALGEPGALGGDLDRAAPLTDGSGRLTVGEAAAFEGKVPSSIEIWVKAAPTDAGLGFLMDHTRYEGSRDGWVLRSNDDVVAIERWSAGESRSVIAPAVSKGEWHHLVVTYDGLNQRIYVDSVKRGEGGGDLPIPSRESTLTIGHQSCSCGGSNSFVGSIDEVAIYDKVLTDARVAAHWAAAK